MPKDSLLELIALRASGPQFDISKGEAGLPTKILVLAWGDHATTKGQVICNETTMRELMAYNASQNWDRPYFDYEHSSIPGSPTYKGEPCDIAGHAASLLLSEGEGIFYMMPALSNWTESGRKNVPAGNYPDLSPVVKVNEKNEVIGLHSVAFCRHGATPGLVFLSAAPAVQHKSASATDPSQSATTMTLEEFSKALAKALGLPETAMPEEILAGLTEQLTAAGTKAEDATKALSTLTKERDALKLLTAANPNADQLTALSTQLAEQGDTLKTLSINMEASERGGVIAAAIGAGKQVPSIASAKKADGSFQMPLDQLKQLCAELPVTVPMEKRTPTLETLMLSGGPHASAEVEGVSKLTGVTDEQRKKHANR